MMRRKTRRIIGAVALIAALAAGGVAFTATNTVVGSNNVAGYGTQQITGATVHDTHYTLSADGTLIEQVVLDFSPAINGTSHSADGTADIVKIGFGPSPTVTAPALPTACVVAADGATATCGDVEGQPAAMAVTNSDAASGTLAIAVSHP
jgi:hypothetical protein